MTAAISLFKTIVFGGSDSTEEDPIFFKDFNEAAMFQIADIVIESRNKPWNQSASASFELSVKNSETFRVARQYEDKGDEFKYVMKKPKSV
jgi:hypothetical protein